MNEARIEQEIKILPKSEFERKSQLMNSFAMLKKIDDERFGVVALVQNSNNGQLGFMKEKITTSQKEAAREIVIAKLRMESNHKYTQNLLDYSSGSKSDFCSKFYKIRTIYEYQKNHLKKEMEYRKKGKEHFDHEELTHIVYQVIAALDHYQMQDKPFGDLRPLFISVDNQAKEYKLCDRLKHESDARQAQMNNMISSLDMYCSPELYNLIKTKEKDISTIDLYKNDTFSLGMILLELGIMEDIQGCYENDGFNAHILQKHISTFFSAHQKHNPLLCNILENLLNLRPEERLTPHQFNDGIEPSYSEILSYFNSTSYQNLHNSLHQSMSHEPKYTKESASTSFSQPESQQYTPAYTPHPQYNYAPQAQPQYAPKPKQQYAQQPQQQAYTPQAQQTYKPQFVPEQRQQYAPQPINSYNEQVAPTYQPQNGYAQSNYGIPEAHSPPKLSQIPQKQVAPYPSSYNEYQPRQSWDNHNLQQMPTSSTGNSQQFYTEQQPQYQKFDSWNQPQQHSTDFSAWNNSGNSGQNQTQWDPQTQDNRKDNGMIEAAFFI